MAKGANNSVCWYDTEDYTNYLMSFNTRKSKTRNEEGSPCCISSNLLFATIELYRRLLLSNGEKKKRRNIASKDRINQNTS